TALYHDYEDVRDDVGSACSAAQHNKVMALENMARRVDLPGVPESAVFVFSPLPWARKALVEFHTEQNPAKDSPPISHLVAPDGDHIPIQWRPADSMTQFWPRLSAWVDVPACGYRVYELAHGDLAPATAFATFATVNERGLGLSSLKATDGAELLAAPIGLVVIADPSDTWAHGVNSFRQEIGRPTFEAASVVENGPQTRVIRQRAHWRDSEIICDIAYFAGLDVVEFRFVINWHEREQILKLEIPTAFSSPRIFAKVPGGVAPREIMGDEEPCQDWIAIEGTVAGTEYTIALLNDGTYSYDCLNGLVRTILIRSAP